MPKDTQATPNPRAPIFDGKSDWNPMMWKGSDHAWNQLGASEWNIAHVRNSINAYNSVPDKHHALSVKLLDALLSDVIAYKRDFQDLQRLYRETEALRKDTSEALANNDVIRALALLDAWHAGNRKWTTIGRKP